MFELLRGFAILSLAQFLGEVLRRVLGIPIPGNVLGFGLLAVALFAGIIRVEAVAQAAKLLLDHLTLFFAPVIVGIVLYKELFRTQWLPMMSAIVVSTAITLVLVGKLA
ncbi:MAG: CidA/LrgA family protein, partial [Firmicutes bacterium]|nr:CidA/LrgA family protein [Bacillota bacterium]